MEIQVNTSTLGIVTLQLRALPDVQFNNIISFPGAGRRLIEQFKEGMKVIEKSTGVLFSYEQPAVINRVSYQLGGEIDYYTSCGWRVWWKHDRGVNVLTEAARKKLATMPDTAELIAMMDEKLPELRALAADNFRRRVRSNADAIRANIDDLMEMIEEGSPP